MNQMLGRKPRRPYPESGLRLAKYAAGATAPASVDWYAKLTSVPLYLNDRIGDCTWASLGHTVGVWTANSTGTEALLADADVLKAYVAVTGAEGAAYDPSTGANDNGCNMQDVLLYARTVGLGGHKILNHAIVNIADHNEVMLAPYWFGSLYLGVNLPLTAQNSRGTWDVRGPLIGRKRPGSWGGHAVQISCYDDETITCTTWGQKQAMTWAWFDAYADEAYAPFSLDWLNASAAANGLDFNTLLGDLNQFT